LGDILNWLCRETYEVNKSSEKRKKYFDWKFLEERMTVRLAWLAWLGWRPSLMSTIKLLE
jgi:hypothetical protein